MKSLTLVLIPLIFLSSCTIDWNDEKDRKIAELAGQLNDSLNEQLRLSTAYSELQGQYTKKFYSENLLMIRKAECDANLENAQKN
jgi:hypothetical protein